MCNDFSTVLRIKKNFEKNLKLSFFLNLLTKDQINFKKTIVYECLYYGIKQTSFTLLVCDLEI